MNFLSYLKTSKCPECFNTNIKHDYIKKERYCSRCGLILQSLTPATRKELDYIMKKIQQ